MIDDIPAVPPESSPISEGVGSGRPDPAEVIPRRATTPAWLLLAALTVLVLLLGLGMEPALRWAIEKPPRFGSVAIPVSEVVQHTLLRGLTALWFFALGASLGSFLHCVAYRAPRGISVVARGSSCPRCGTPIRAWHNVPVFGWLWLRGRCAVCGWNIPPRYAFTELAFGTVFLLLMGVELVGAGLNLPGDLPARRLGVVDNVWDPNWRLIETFAYHATLLTVLMTACLFAADRFRLPALLVVIGVAVGCVSPLLVPALQPVGWDGLKDRFHSWPLFRTTLTLACGGAVGLLLGGCLARRQPGNLRACDAASTIAAMLLVGLYLGWQASVAIAAIAALMRLVWVLTPGRSWPGVVSITIATLLHLIAWRWLAENWLYPDLGGSVAGTAVTVLSGLVAPLVIDGIEHGGDAGPGEIESPAERPMAQEDSVVAVAPESPTTDSIGANDPVTPSP